MSNEITAEVFSPVDDLFFAPGDVDTISTVLHYVFVADMLNRMKCRSRKRCLSLSINSLVNLRNRTVSLAIEKIFQDVFKF